MLVPRENIQDLLPQKPPFVMVDELLFHDENTTRCAFTIVSDNIFTDNGIFGEPGVVENIAQTAAAGVGYYAQATNTPVPVGYIGAIKDLEILKLAKTGDRLLTEVTVINKVFDVTMIKGTVTCNGELAATCEMKIFLSKQS